MKFVKLILYSVIILFVVLSFLFAVFPSNVRVSRLITISASKSKVETIIKQLSSWKDWNLLTRNSNMKVSSNPDGQGTWLQSDHFRINITEVNQDTIKMACAGSGNREFKGGFYTVDVPGTQSSTVEWYLNFHVKWYPWEKMASMFYDKQLGPSMEASLADLKTYVEKIP